MYSMVLKLLFRVFVEANMRYYWVETSSIEIFYILVNKFYSGK